jgi:hypothetical protein
VSPDGRAGGVVGDAASLFEIADDEDVSVGRRIESVRQQSKKAY